MSYPAFVIAVDATTVFYISVTVAVKSAGTIILRSSFYFIIKDFKYERNWG